MAIGLAVSALDVPGASDEPYDVMLFVPPLRKSMCASRERRKFRCGIDVHQKESLSHGHDASCDGIPEATAMRERALSLLAGCGLFQAGMGLYFIALRPAMLAEDEKFTGASLEAITLVAPSISMWLDRVFIVLGGHAVAAGLLIVLVAIQSWRRTVSLVALTLIASAGGVSVVLMSAVNFAINSDFRWLLLLPALAWAGAVLLLAREWTGARGRGPQGSTDLQATGG